MRHIRYRGGREQVVLLACLIGYLLGSISSSYIAGKVSTGVDIREHGSGNAGATNALRVLGWRLAALVLVADVFKGVLAVAFGNLVTEGWPAALALSGLAAVLGHNWPAFHGFRGGKGIATTIGALLTLTPGPALYALLVAAFLLVVSRYVSLAALGFVTFTPVFQLFMHVHPVYTVVTVVIALLAYWRHRGNIERLRHKTERRLTLRS